MLKRLLLIAFGLTLVCLAVLFLVLRDRDQGPKMQDVAGAIRLLPQPRPLSEEERLRLDGDLATARGQLEAFRAQLSPPRLLEIDPGNSRAKLGALEARLKLADQNPAGLRQDLLELREYWIQGRIDLESLAQAKPRTADYPSPPPFALEAYGGLRGTPEAEQYLQLYLATQRQQVDAYRQARRNWETVLTERLTQQGRVRALREQSLSRAYNLGYSASELTDDNFGRALAMELDTFRLRLFYKLVQFRVHWARELQQGKYVQMLREVGVPLFALSLTLLLVPMSSRVPLTGRTGRLVSWLILYALLWGLSASMSGSNLLLEISVLVYLTANLILFRAWRVAALIVASRLVRAVRFQDPVAGRRRVSASIVWTAGLWLLCDSLEMAVRVLTVGKGLIYWGVVDLSHLLYLLFYLGLAYSWRREVVHLLHPLHLSGAWMEQPLPALLLMPVLFPVWLGLTLLLWLVLVLQDTEWGGQIATGALRHWMERLRGKRTIASGAPAAYRESFLQFHPPSDEVLPLSDPSFLPGVRHKIESWLEERSPQNRLMVVGRPGSGKRSLVDLAQRLYGDQVRFVRIRFAERVLDESSLLEMLREGLGLQEAPPDLEAAAAVLASQPRTILALEGVHQLFLSSLGGFSLLRSLIVLWRITPRNIFWLCTGGYHAQAYLNRALDSEAETTLELPLWTEDALRHLILEGHRRTGYELEYDPEIWSQPSSESQSQGLEAQFFRLLWEQSGGNPATARAIWLHSLEARETSLLATLPNSNLVSRVQAAPTPTHLVLAAVVRHESLTEADAARATDLSPRVVRLALAQAAEWGVLRSSEQGTYRVDPLWVKDVETLLKRKNMLYAL